MPMSFGGVSKQKVATVIVAADGTGDTTDIQTGINMLPAGGGGVYVKEGTYTITLTITIAKSNVSIIGAGNSTIIKLGDDFDAFTIGDGVNGYDYIIIENLFINGDLKDGIGILFKGLVSMSRVNKTIIRLCNDGAIEFEGNDRMNITNNYLEGNGSPTDPQINGTVLEWSTISNNIFYTGGSAIFVDGTNNVVTGNNLIGLGGYGIKIADDDNVINSNQIATVYDECIYLNGVSDCEVVGNRVSRGASLGVGGDNILLDGNSDNNIISSNTSINCQQGYGINISAATCNKNIITGNICLGNVGGQINDSGTDTHPNGVSGTNNLELDDLNIIA